LITKQFLLEESFDSRELKITSDKIQYKDIEARKIIFCDGAGSFESPWFKQLPFAPNKGEALIVEIPELPESAIYKKSVLLAPLAGAGHFFWAGSNYIWDFDNPAPTAAFREATERSLKEWLKLPFKIVEHLAGIRPATLERRPFVGMHPVFPGIGILNGMGTKGCSLAPFFAKQLTDHLVHHTPINADADIKRFGRILAR
jgi:glycine/D-amino acid oxidase-like deaminating enzyme